MVYRGMIRDRIDFPELGKAIASLKPGIVDYSNSPAAQRERISWRP